MLTFIFSFDRIKNCKRRIYVMNETEKKQDIIIPESERVQFSKPETIANYGKSLLDEMRTVANAVARFRGQRIHVDLGPMQNEAGQIKNFQKYLTEVQEHGLKKDDQSSQGMLKKLGMRFLKSLSQSNNKQSNNKQSGTFLECYEAYQGILDEIAKKYDNRAKGTIEETKLLNSYVETIKPLLKKLEYYIEAGHEALNQEIKKTEALGDQLTPIQMQVLQASTNAFRRRLASLETALRTLQNSVSQTSVIMIGNMDLLAQYQEMDSIGLSTLRVMSVNILETKIQSVKITELESDRTALNQTMISHSQVLSNNVDRLQNLTNQTMIDVETVKEVLNETEMIAKKIDQSREMAEAYNEKVEQFYQDSAEINRALDETLEMLVQSASMNSSYTDLTEGTRQMRKELEQALQSQEQGGKRISFFNRFRRNNKN